MQEQINKRILSIDVLRGLVMLIMALDHARDFFHAEANTADPMDLATTTPLLYFTRWITHFCAPVFVFLSGISIYLQGLRKSAAELSRFLILRGLWLIVAEVLIISFGWTFNPFYTILAFQVIWAIGISMLLIGVLMFLKASYRVILFIGLSIVLLHNMLDYYEASATYTPGFWGDLLHHGVFKPYHIIGNHYVLIVYPFLPWLGLMMTGYACGVLYSKESNALIRHKVFLWGGWGLIALFVLLRYSKFYGEKNDWSIQQNDLLTLMSFLNTTKYPPSLAYMLMTIGPAMLLLVYLEKAKGAIASTLLVFGQTAFFYYILHIYLIHLITVLLFFWRGHQLNEVIQSAGKQPFLFVVPGEGFSLGGVYGMWLLVLILLYPFCSRFNAYRNRHKEKTWLRYI